MCRDYTLIGLWGTKGGVQIAHSSLTAGVFGKNLGQIGEVQFFRHVRGFRNFDDVAAAWCALHGLAVAVFHRVGRESQVAGRGDELQLVAGGKFIFYVDGCTKKKACKKQFLTSFC